LLKCFYAGLYQPAVEADNQPAIPVLKEVKVPENPAQAEPRWPCATANAHNVDRDLSQDDRPEDEFAYSSN
jgi:hypothetical protein